MGLKRSKPMRNKLDGDHYGTDMFDKNYGNITSKQFSKTDRDRREAGIKD